MVIRAILGRYLTDDPSWALKPDGKLPRFLLNDVIRFWRTMSVDFADKFHDQEGDKWALRNAKLRFSRKLILLTGMLGCFSLRLHGFETSAGESDPAAKHTIAHFEKYFSRPPLEILADEMLKLEAPQETCGAVFSAYDEFLAILDEEKARTELETIARKQANKSEVFQHVRELSHRFQGGLLNWLYMPETGLCRLVKEYALF
jgi:hypothetical protein